MTKTVALAAHERAAVATKNIAWRVPEHAGRYSQAGEVAAHEGRALGFAKVAPTLKDEFLAWLDHTLLHEEAHLSRAHERTHRQHGQNRKDDLFHPDAPGTAVIPHPPTFAA
jgi:hypothetical protein